VTDEQAGEHPSRETRLKIRRWGLWSLPRRALGYILGIELLALIAGLVIVLNGPAPTNRDLLNAAILIIAATAHLLISRRIEESRSDQSSGPHVNTTVVWMFPAAALLAPLLAIALLLWVRVLLYPISRRPLYRHTFSSAEVVLSVVAVVVVLRIGAVDHHNLESGVVASEVLVVIAAAVAYFLVQAVIVGVVIVLSTPKPTWSAVIGTRGDNAFEALALCMATLVALAVAESWFAPLLVVPLVCAADWAARQVEQLRGDSRTDHVTALLNARGWHEQAARETARVARQGGTFAVAVLDLDHFKQVNDTWGHPAGDAVLRMVAEVLNECTRQGDVVGRIGGEEFALLLPDTNAEQALVVAERVRVGIAEMHVPATDKRGQPVTIVNRTTSVGVAAGRNGSAELTGLVAAADSALYDAKVAGRNRIVLSADGDRSSAHRQSA
jgi:diguanylate cyclase (GGDEF)-like protein